MTELREIARQLASQDPEERRYAVRRLSGDTREEAVDLLLQGLGDQDWRVRKQATSVAVAMAPAGTVLRRLVEALGPKQNDVGLRNAAVEALSGFGVASVDALSIALPALDADGRKLAAEALGRTGHAAALLVLAAMVNDPDPNVRAAVVEAVAGVGATCVDDVTPLLERFLADRDPLLRLTALNGLNELGVVIPWQRLEDMLDEPVLRSAALLAAGRSGDPAAGRLIASALARTRGALSDNAMSAMVTFIRSGSNIAASAREALAGLPAEVVRRLLHLADNPDEPVEERRLALIVVGATGLAEAGRVAVRALSDDRVAAEAEESLALLGRVGTAALVEAVESGVQSDRALGIETLARLVDSASPEAALAADAIRARLSDPSPDVIASALEALATLGDALSFGPAAELLRSDNPRVRRAATVALGTLARRQPAAARDFTLSVHPDGPDAHAGAVVLGALGSPVLGTIDQDVAFLTGVLGHGDTLPRRAALEALANRVSAQAIEVVAFALADEEPEVRRTAVRALGRMRTPEGDAPGLSHLLRLAQRGDDHALVIDAVHALGDADDPRAYQVLLGLLQEGTPMVAVAAVEALGTLPASRRIGALAVGLSHPDPEVVKASLQRLATQPEPEALGQLLGGLEHPAWDVRRLAADLLGEVGGEGVTAALRERLSIEVEPLVRDALQRALLELELATTGPRRTTPPPLRGSTRPR
jgi:HEAT repeat protein